MKTSDFDYSLPPEAIAQTPLEPRDSSRLFVLNRRTGHIEHNVFHQLGHYLRRGDLLIVNETRVIPARLYATKPSGGKVELLLLQRVSSEANGETWEALVGGKRITEGKRLRLEDGLEAEVTAVLEGSRRQIHFTESIESHLARLGHTPLPPYIHTPLDDPERYQTVYARQPGSAAAPTAGLHFTPRLIETLKAQGIGFAAVTLHVGLDTFAPVTEESPTEHVMHTEWRQIPPETAALVNQAKSSGGRVIAVGTTSVRTLESAARDGRLSPLTGPTDLFILPGYQYQIVDAMITNFHLPKSTLLMLVSAFAGKSLVLSAYQTAVQEGYRFYSFGDAMLII